MKTIIAAAIVGLFPVAAAAQAPADARSSVAAATPSGGPAVKTAKPTRYCVVDQITGSRIPRKTCLSRNAWLAQGVDPLKTAR